jgi:peptidoglycan/xylan/chitin deacetylase (PgdA/CDA1 family)
MQRRTFLKTAALGSLTASISSCRPANKTHILTLSFDDGFKKSFYKIAEIYERYDLRACLNVIASGHLPGFQQVDQWILPELMGSFDDWNALKARGHEIMPHSWKHLNLAKQPLEEAKELILKCLDYFAANLEGYENAKAVFNFPFNASTPELEAFALSKVKAIRTRGETAINAIPVVAPYRQGCWSMGPDNADQWVEEQVTSFLSSPGGWLILNLHGLENEGWGPLSTGYLSNLLERMVKVDYLDILPAGEVLEAV